MKKTILNLNNGAGVPINLLKNGGPILNNIYFFDLVSTLNY